LIIAATSDRPKLSLKAFSARRLVMMAQKASGLSVAVLRKRLDSGMRTMSASQASVTPSVIPKPGTTLGERPRNGRETVAVAGGCMAAVKRRRHVAQ